MSVSAEPKLCFVNCGLPSEQCACYRNMMQDLGVSTVPDIEELPGIVKCPKCSNSRGILRWVIAGQYQCPECNHYWR